LRSSSFYNHQLNMTPIRIELELTEACNLNCKFCYNTQSPSYLNIKKAKSIIRSLSDQGVLEIVLTGGEPMIHPDFDIISKYAAKHFHSTMLQTNGTQINSKSLRELEVAGFNGINISIHGDSDTHENLTGKKGSYQKAINAINLVLSSKLTLWVNTVLTSVNLDCLNFHINSLYEIGVRHFTFTRFNPTGIGKSFDIKLSPSDLVKAISIIDRFHKDHPDSSVLAANAIPRCLLPDNLKGYSEGCSYGLSRFYVNTNGELMFCGMSRICLGDITVQSVLEAKKHSEIFKQHCLGQTIPDDCLICEEFTKCRGGCRAAAYASSGSISGKDPYMKGNLIYE